MLSHTALAMLGDETSIMPRHASRRNSALGRRQSVIDDIPYAAAEDLPTYSETMTYEEKDHPRDVARRAVKNHEKRVKQDMRIAEKDAIDCARIEKLIPEIYDQLSNAVAKPIRDGHITGPAALRPVEESGIEIEFKCKNIDQKALRKHLPRLLAEYQQRILAEARGEAPVSPQDEDDVLFQLNRPRAESVDYTALNANPPRDPMLARRASTSSTTLLGMNPDRMAISAGYFESYTPKIYFSRKFIALWKKKEDGSRDNVLSGIAMVLVGIKFGLPLFDLVTFAGIDCPRLFMQNVTGRQKLTLWR